MVQSDNLNVSGSTPLVQYTRNYRGLAVKDTYLLSVNVKNNPWLGIGVMDSITFPTENGESLNAIYVIDGRVLGYETALLFLPDEHETFDNQIRPLVESAKRLPVPIYTQAQDCLNSIPPYKYYDAKKIAKRNDTIGVMMYVDASLDLRGVEPVHGMFELIYREPITQ